MLLILIHSIYRIRTQRLLEIERIRTRIASDLHDDIGSTLSRITILSESVRRSAVENPAILAPLASVAEASREAIDSMSDIVWAVNPRKDQLQDLVNRMRHVAGEMLSERMANFQPSISQAQAAYVLNPDLKRNVFLIFKECLHNIVRHSDSSKIDICLEIKNGSLLLEIYDNGKGFDPSIAFAGQGLKNIKKRAGDLSGEIEITSQVGEGTLIRLTVPLPTQFFIKRGG